MGSYDNEAGRYIDPWLTHPVFTPSGMDKHALRFGLRLLSYRMTDWDWPGFLLIQISR